MVRKKQNKRTNNNVEDSAQKINDWAKRTPTKRVSNTFTGHNGCIVRNRNCLSTVFIW